MKFQSCMLILVFILFVKVQCDEISLLKEYFTTSLLEENREILSQPLTQDIEDIINQKIAGFKYFIETPRKKSRIKRDASNNEVSPSEGCKFKKFVFFIKKIYWKLSKT